MFVSSTFSDTKEERNTLLKEVVPSVREYARSHGLEYQFLDLRWGIRDEAQDNHEIVDICLQQLRACQVLSPHLNFVSLLGHKYGWRPLPTRVRESEFRIIIDHCPNADEKALLLKWYRLDLNALPATYKLLPISTHLPHFLDEDKGPKFKAAESEWYKTFDELQLYLRNAVELIPLGERRVKRSRYYDSVTDDETRHGLFDIKNPQEALVWFRRNLHDLDQNIDDAKSGIFTDVNRATSSVHTESRAKLKILLADIKKTVGATPGCIVEYPPIDFIRGKGQSNPKESLSSSVHS